MLPRLERAEPAPPLAACACPASPSVPVTALATGIYDAVPQTATSPYVVFDEPLEVPDRAFGQGGHAVNFILVVFTQDGTRDKSGRGTSGYAQGFAIAEEICAALTDTDDPLVVDGHDVVDVDVESIVGQREDDGVTRRIEITITATLEDDGS